MTTSTKYYFVAILFFILTLYSLTCAKKSWAGEGVSIKTDSVPAKKYVVVFDINDVYGRGNKLDSATLILQYVGKTQSVDQADQIKEYYLEVMRRFLSLGKIDSVVVGNKPDSTIKSHKNK